MGDQRAYELHYSSCNNKVHYSALNGNDQRIYWRCEFACLPAVQQKQTLALLDHSPLRWLQLLAVAGSEGETCLHS